MKVIAFMGKSGSGKDTIVKALVSKYPDKYNEIVSCTTRPPREGELDGINYYFLTNEEFYQKIICHKMLEWANFNHWCYGTDKDALIKDKINIGVFNPAGIRNLMKQEDIELKVYYVRAADKERLLRQLNRENNPDVDEIVRRYVTDKEDFEHLEDIPYIEIYNDDKRLLNCLVEAINEDNLD